MSNISMFDTHRIFAFDGISVNFLLPRMAQIKTGLFFNDVIKMT